MNLTNGALVEILNGKTPENPKFQLINARKIGSSANAVDRYRLILSDGDYMYSHIMLAAQLNNMIVDGALDNLAIIEVPKYMCNVLNGDKKVVILLDVKVLQKGSDVNTKIGNPAQLNPTQIPSTPSERVDPQSCALAKEESAHGKENALSMVHSPVNNNTLKTNKSLTPNTPGSNRVFQIANLTPYQNRWRIRARLTNKSNIRTWNNSRGEGKLFNINLLDESGEIRCTGFNEQVDKFYNMLEVNKVYYFSKCTLKTANKQYNTLNCDYEMTMNSETIIEPCNDQVDLPTMTFDFIQLSSMEKHKPNSNVDVIGICKVCKDVGTVIGRASQKEISKRDLQIVDQSGVAVNLTLWGDDATKFDGNGCPVIAVKGARVSDFGGRSLSVGGGSVMMINPDIKEAHILRGWYEEEGRDFNFSSFQGEGGPSGSQSTNWKTFAQAKLENLGQGNKADYFTAKGTVIFLKRDNCMYQACPSAECNKKVIDLGNGLYRCEKCNKELPNFKWRMILSANIADHSDNQWITCFQESAEAMLDIKADKLGALRQDDEMGFDNVMQEALFKSYIFRMRAKMETYNDENRLKTVCMSATPMNWMEYGQHLLDELEQMGI